MPVMYTSYVKQKHKSPTPVTLLTWNLCKLQKNLLKKTKRKPYLLQAINSQKFSGESYTEIDPPLYPQQQWFIYWYYRPNSGKLILLVLLHFIFVIISSY